MYCNIQYCIVQHHYIHTAPNVSAAPPKVLWKGREAMAAALELVRAAEMAAAARTAPRRCSKTRGPASFSVASDASGCTQKDSTSAAPSSSFSAHDSTGVDGGDGGGVEREGDHPPRFVWANGLARPAASAKQARVLSRGITSSTAAAAAAAAKAHGRVSSSAPGGTLGVRCVSPDELVALVPGLTLPTWVQSAAAATVDPERQQQQQQPEGDSGRANAATSGSSGQPQQEQQGDLGVAAAAAGVATAAGSSSAQQQQQQISCAGMFIPCGVVLDVPRYLESVWRACQV